MIRFFFLGLSAAALVMPLQAGVVVSTTFSGSDEPMLRAYGAGIAEVDLESSVKKEGTIDEANGDPGDAAVLTAKFGGAAPGARAGLAVGPIAMKTSQKDAAMLTVNFDLWVSEIRPVSVSIQSLDDAGKITGTHRATVIPPVAGAFYRFHMDLGGAGADGATFDPAAPQVGFSFEITDEAGPSPVSREQPMELRVDNLNFTEPSYFVSPKGKDSANGRTPQTAFGTVAKAVAAVEAGDVIMLMDGDAFRNEGPNALTPSISKAGKPDAWIVIRNHPGQKPKIVSVGWEVFKFVKGSAYWEIRGLEMQGNRANVTIEDAIADGAIQFRENGRGYPGDPKFNGNCISIEGRTNTDPASRPHHFRIVGNHVYEFGGGGISGMGCDYLTIENNLVHDNAHTMRYAGSGISLLHTADFDRNTGYKCFVIGNTTYNNRCYVPWARFRKNAEGEPIPNSISDGNGIIVDDNVDFRNYVQDPGIPYVGRTLLQNNLAYNNGGSGLHTFASNHVDFINNTAYHNVQSPELRWNQMFAGPRSSDIHFVNNIMWAQAGKPMNRTPGNAKNNIMFVHNIIFGDGNNDTRTGGGLGGEVETTTAGNEGNIFANPGFVRASVDPKVADFRLKVGSPAIDAGVAQPVNAVPIVDIVGDPRPSGKAPDIGAYEFRSTP